MFCQSTVAKMFRYFLSLSLTLCLSTRCLANDIGTEDDIHVTVENPSSPDKSTIDKSEVPNEIEILIKKIEHLAAQAEKTVKEGILPIEYTNKLYSGIEEAVEELVELTYKTTNIYNFLNSNGIERTVLPNIGIPHPTLKRQLLLLIRNLFDVAPITTNAVIPTGVVDKILDIFENDNLALKAHALDILQIWLPDNPIIQTRVMKMKGLEPFYRQILKLDVDVIGQLLELFNKILIEHMNARRKDVQRTKSDRDRLIMYQRIGLLERLSTPVSCNGLLHIFETSWTFNTEGKEITQPIIEAVKNVKPFCINYFKANPRPTKLFQELLKYIGEPRRQNSLEKKGINVTDTEIILKEYSDIFKNVFTKDEF